MTATFKHRPGGWVEWDGPVTCRQWIGLIVSLLVEPSG